MKVRITIPIDQAFVLPPWCHQQAVWAQTPDLKARRARFVTQAVGRIRAGDSTPVQEARRGKAEGFYSPTTYLKDISTWLERDSLPT